MIIALNGRENALARFEQEGDCTREPSYRTYSAHHPAHIPPPHVGLNTVRGLTENSAQACHI